MSLHLYVLTYEKVADEYNQMSMCIFRYAYAHSGTENREGERVSDIFLMVHTQLDVLNDMHYLIS